MFLKFTGFERHRSKRPLSACRLLVLAVLLCIGMSAQAPSPKSQPSKAAVPVAAPVSTSTGAVSSEPDKIHEMTSADVGAFIDGILPLQLGREDIAGAVVLVVKDGKVLFAKGYGYADVDKKLPVTPDGTLFRPGSTSKLFTWTSVLQLVEAGKLDLDRDVSDYLDFKIPATYSQPITLRNIMTHTAGFEETIKSLWVPTPSDLKPLREYLIEHMPARIFPPGVTPAYSNYATTMAGYIVQRVSGESFDDYIEHHILNPLGMQHSTFRQPLPDNLKSLMSSGYKVGSEPSQPFELVQPWPAGSSSMTAMDLSHFMIAHLQDGKYENTEILKPETARLMHARQFENLPQMHAMALGFYEETRNGHRIIGHGGDTEFFHSDLHLILDAGVGFFVSYNSAGKGEISPREALWHQFLDRYYPYAPPAGVAVANAEEDAKTVSGSYISSRRFESSFLAVLTPLGQMKVSPGPDHTIICDELKNLNGKPKHFEEIGPLMFRNVDGQDLLGFKRDASGRLVAVIDWPFMVSQRAYWYQASTFNMIVLGGALGLFLLTLLLWPVGYFIRRHYRQTLKVTPALGKLRTWVRIVCAIDISFVLTFVAIVVHGEKDISIFTPKMDFWFHLLQFVGWLGVLGTLIALWNARESWRYAGRGRWSKVGDTLLAVAAVGFSWFVIHWNLVHWVGNY
jgi:CubicO group peptidase (beta-lactamase class C family)